MSEMLDQIGSLGRQLRWAAAESVPALSTASDVLFAGMGGSGIAGDYSAVVAAPQGTRVTVHKSYGPVPLWAIRQRPLVIAASYSGNTEETLDLVTSAHEAGLAVVVITTGGRLAEMAGVHRWPHMQVPGGFQPRAAIGYMVGATLRILESANAVPDQRLAFVEAIELAERAVAPGSAAWEDARKVADGLRGRIPIIYGSTGLTAPVAQRWKTQINENAKVPAWWSLLPELDHNEITGWETMPELTRESLGIAALRDRDDHRRIESRLAHTTRLTQDAVPWAAEVHSSGDSLLARLVSLTVVGDLVSLMMAEDAGTDPVPVETIERLKRLLAEEEK